MAETPQSWSTTAASNSQPDGTSASNIAEGNLPSTVNNAIRSVMAGSAMLREALSGKKVSAGTADAQTLTTGLSLASYATAPLLAFEAGAALTNTTTTTMAIDGLAAKTVKRVDGSDLSAGDITAGGIYLIAHEATADVLILLNPKPTSASAPQFTTIELGHASDTTLARSGAGDITIESNAVYRAGGTDVPVTDGGTGASTAADAFAALKQAATQSATGVVELATAAELRTGTDTARVPAVDQVWASAAEVTLTDAATIAVDFSTFINAVVTLTDNRALGNPTNEKAGQSGYIRIVQDGTGSRTLSYGSDWEFAGGTAPVLTTTASAQDLLFYQVIAADRVYASLVKAIS